ncbi:50S ribosomal protein L1 [Candidatus Bathyarchaeota archaeon]|nr:50S ribosomal protein L1 [Candidatus Bathyarchaeota archaeon]
MSLDARNVLQAIKEVKDGAEKRNFVQSLELIVNLREIDLKKPENRFQELVELPHLVGERNRICVIASGEMALRAKRIGADLVLQRSELESFAGDKKKLKELGRTYDFFIAEASLMPVVGRVLGAALGPRGKMPTPISPSADIKEYIEKYRKMVLIRLRGQPVLQCRVGTEKMSDNEVAENIHALMSKIEEKLKRGIQNVRSIYVKSTMGSPFKVKM